MTLPMLTRARRSLARLLEPSPRQQRRFDGASHGRPWQGVPSTFGRPQDAVALASTTIRERARYFYGSNPHARAGVEAWVTGLVGPGIRATPKHPDADTRAAISGAIDDWSDLADLDGLTDWYGLQANIARAVVVDGEALVMLVDTPEGLRLRQIPAEQLDASVTRPLDNGGSIVNGVEFDSVGRRVAYWIQPTAGVDPYATWAAPQRFDAANAIHIFHRDYPGQVRGLSWLAPVLLKLNELDQATYAMVTGIKVAAMFAGFLKADADFDGDAPFSDADSIATGLEPGTVKYLPAGYDLKFTTPAQAQQASEFLNHELRAIAAGLGVAAHLISRDLSQANYSSLRADLVAFRQSVEQRQYGMLAPQLTRPVFARVVTSLALSGSLPAPDFELEPGLYTGAEFIMPRQPWVDPAKEAQGYQTMIATGFTSRRKVVAELGWSVEDLDTEIAADVARERANGLNFTAPNSQQERSGGADAPSS